ncbi:hypothetical protein HOY80DRAFT_1102879 [Tuber brumale]|nr:hypothetical protein HOY80DRAFT_1102879 [Tuber brumale]
MASSDQDDASWFQYNDRFSWRDTFIYDSIDRDTVLGGLRVCDGMTNINLYFMVEIVCIFTDTFQLGTESADLVPRDERPLEPGNYYLVSNGSITITDEAPLFRTISVQTGTRRQSFCHAVRLRDQRCVITGRPAILDGVAFWRVFEAAHIVPLKYQKHWNDNNFARWISIPPARESDGTINSVQNGILLESTMHCLFDSYKPSINPDDNNKIVCFTPLASTYGIAGSHLDRRFLEHDHSPPIELFRWHFRQATLVNLKGAGEPCFQTDPPPGPSPTGEVMSSPTATGWMGFQSVRRLQAQETPS